MHNFMVIEDYDYYTGDIGNKIDGSDGSLSEAFSRIRILIEIVSLISSLSCRDFVLKDVLNHRLFEHFSDNDIRELFAKADIPIEHWHYLIQGELSHNSLHRLIRFVIDTTHQGNLYAATMHYDKHTSGLILSVLAQ